MSAASKELPNLRSRSRIAKLRLYYVCRALGLFRLAHRLTRGHLKILCYHGFEMNDEASFRPKLFIRPADFEQRLATIERYGMHVMPLGQAVKLLYEKALPPNAIAITIDDGFYSVHEKALPLLERFEFPATVYVTTYYVERPNPVFRLVVQYMFATTARRDTALLDVPWRTGGALCLADADARQRAAWECIHYGELQREDERVAICERLGEMLGTPYAAIVASKAFALMTPAQLGSLERSCIAVELHTHRHVLPPADRDAVLREIADNRAVLAQWVQRELVHFCYPSGLWDARQWPWLDAAGIKSSTTCLPGLNSASTPRHALHRFLDGANIEQIEFEAALSGFSDLLRNCVQWRPLRSRGQGTPPGPDEGLPAMPMRGDIAAEADADESNTATA